MSEPSEEHAPLSEPTRVKPHKGPFAWMARNRVAANLLMIGLLAGGLLFLQRIKQEVFPEFALDIVTVSLVYPGASPEEVERAVTKAVEENIRSIEDVKEVRSTSREGVASITVELELGADGDRALSDVKAAVDRISTFPQDVERPITSLAQIRSEVVSLVVYGDASEKSLRVIADRMRDQLLRDERVSQVELAAVRPYEISVEVPRDRLRAYGLTLQQVADAIRAANVEVPAGGIKTDSGEILLRTSQRRDFGPEFGSIVIVSRPDGSSLRLSDIATIDDSFSDTDQEAMFNGQPAAMVRVYRVADQTPITVSDAVTEFIEAQQASLPAGVKLARWNDRSEMYRDRIDLLMRNAYMGLALVMLCLGLFLEIRLAFWVTMGIPISFLGAILLMPAMDVSINMISLFAFIVTLGIVVDDAIVVGEAIYKRRRDGLPALQAAVTGAHDVAKPVIFSVLTTVAAFSPLLFVPGTMGKFFRNIPLVVISVLMLSLVESLLVLPAHLGHKSGGAGTKRALIERLLGSGGGPFGWIHRAQQRFSDRFERWIEESFTPQVVVVVSNRYLAVAVASALLIGSIGYIAGGRINFTFMPKIESDVVFAQVSMPYGTPVETTRHSLDTMVDAAKEVLAEVGGEEKNVRGMLSQLGGANFGGVGRGHSSAGGGSAGGHLAEVAVFLKPVGTRAISAKEMGERWRKKVGDIPGADSLKFTFTTGASSQAPISIRLSHRDVHTLEAASASLAKRLLAFDGVKDVDDGVALGKKQADFQLTPEARSLGVTEIGLARQVRNAFFGAEASRQQRGRDEVRVYVRLPKEQRTSLHDLDELLIATPQGGEMPLGVAAKVKWGRSYTSITRVNGQRILTVEGDVETGKVNANKVMAELRAEALPQVMAEYPGLTYELGGQQQSQSETLGALKDGFKLALLVMFALMAVPLRSYVQPIVIMLAIPFGIVGALAGHVIMGYDLSILSAMGVVALSGVVVNDSLVLISAVNTFREQGMSAYDAMIAATQRRFRPILLTSLTTFFGLAPMILETSMQARFLVPMALSLGFGVLFSTFVILLLVPCVYLILDDFGWISAPELVPHAGGGTGQRVAVEAPMR